MAINLPLFKYYLPKKVKCNLNGVTCSKAFELTAGVFPVDKKFMIKIGGGGVVGVTWIEQFITQIIAIMTISKKSTCTTYYVNATMYVSLKVYISFQLAYRLADGSAASR